MPKIKLHRFLSAPRDEVFEKIKTSLLEKPLEFLGEKLWLEIVDKNFPEEITAAVHGGKFEKMTHHFLLENFGSKTLITQTIDFTSGGVMGKFLDHIYYTNQVRKKFEKALAAIV